MFCGTTETLTIGTKDSTVYVVLQPVLKLVAVKVKIPATAEVPGLPKGVGAGSVGANQPKAMPAPANAFNVIVPDEQVEEYVAEGGVVLLVTVTGTVVVHILTVFVKTTEYEPADVAIKLDVGVCVQTAVEFVPVNALMVTLVVIQFNMDVVGVTV